MRKPLVAGNWKMNGVRASLVEIGEMAKGYDAATRARVEMMVCPPATLIFPAAAIAIGTGIAIGAQDVSALGEGAHTGDLSAGQLYDTGATAVIIGHSERRADHGEKDAQVAAKAEAAMAAGLLPIICVGETRAEREAGKALAVVTRQVRGSIPKAAQAGFVVAYEPVWAIGTGLTPTLADIAEVHAEIRRTLARMFGKDAAQRTRILYGGSVKPANAAEILALADVDGALVGGASLKAADFLAIVRAAS